MTEQAVAATRELHEAGITLALTSGRPPRGMSMLIAPLRLEGAIAGFNGGVFVHPDLSVIESHLLDPATAKETLQLILDQGLDAWVYTEKEWLIRDRQGAPRGARNLDREIRRQGGKFVHRRASGEGGQDRRRLRRPRSCRRLREDGAEKTGREGQCGALAAILSRCHEPAGQQGHGGIDAGETKRTFRRRRSQPSATCRTMF